MLRDGERQYAVLQRRRGPCAVDVIRQRDGPRKLSIWPLPAVIAATVRLSRLPLARYGESSAFGGDAHITGLDTRNLGPNDEPVGSSKNVQRGKDTPRGRLAKKAPRRLEQTLQLVLQTQ